MSTAIPRRKYPVSLAPGSQATSGPVSTWMGDRLGIPGAVDFLLWIAVNNRFLGFEMHWFADLSFNLNNIAKL